MTINFPLFLQITVIGACLFHSSFSAPAFGFGHFSVVCLLSVLLIFALCFAPPAFFGFYCEEWSGFLGGGLRPQLQALGSPRLLPPPGPVLGSVAPSCLWSSGSPCSYWFRSHPAPYYPGALKPHSSSGLRPRLSGDLGGQVWDAGPGIVPGQTSE